MKLAKKHENILKLMAPTWMKKLKDAKWDKYKLSLKNKCILNGNAQHCFIGEMHCMTEAYLTDRGNSCNPCITFCNSVPETLCIAYPEQDKQALLEAISKHFMEFHTDLIALKVQQRAHLVFK